MNVLNNTVLFTLLIIAACDTIAAKKSKSAVLSGINDHKEFKKLLKAKNNVLVLFVVDQTASKSIIDTFKDTAEVVRGHATVVILDCFTKEGKKLCKTLKISEEKPFAVKHYKDGRYHKDYDRNKSVTSMVNFLRDPTGELPWEEDPTATDIVHLQDGDALVKLIKRGPAAFKNTMIMFYAPWCGYCKTLKPEYVMAAADLKGESILAAIDVAKPGNSRIRQQYNITGFPTLLFYERGHFRFPYTGENKRQAIVNFMRDPITQFDVKPPPPADESWSNESDVVHLNGENFEATLQQADNVLIVFYAPWCGHCKKIKPEYEKAAATLKKAGVKGILAAVDATQEPDLAAKFSVSGYPTIKYFSKGEFKFDAGHLRDEQKLVAFIKDPQEPPPPPPPETPWSEEESAVRHLDAQTFRTTLRKARHALVMFYAPWCSHCKRAKPEIMKAAEKFEYELLVLFAAVDCTVEQVLCSKYNITGYPTIKYISHFDRLIADYEGGRTEKDFVNFIHTQLGVEAPKGDQYSSGFGTNVVMLTDDTFENAIASNTPTFVMFFATWCGHCSTTKPAFSAVATEMKSAGGVNVAAADVGTYQKVADLAEVNTMPTFKLFASGKLIANYEGSRSAEDMLQFIKSNTGAVNKKQEL